MSRAGGGGWRACVSEARGYRHTAVTGADRERGRKKGEGRTGAIRFVSWYRGYNSIYCDILQYCSILRFFCFKCDFSKAVLVWRARHHMHTIWVESQMGDDRLQHYLVVNMTHCLPHVFACHYKSIGFLTINTPSQNIIYRCFPIPLGGREQ